MEIDLTEESDDGDTEVDGREKVEEQQEHWNHMIEGERERERGMMGIRRLMVGIRWKNNKNIGTT